MQPQQFTKPFYIFFLMLPTGISTGFVTVTLPYLLSQNGFSVAQTAGIVAFGLSANLLRFLWGPIVDISLSLRKWYLVSLIASLVALLLLCLTPFTVKGAAFLSVVVFISQVAATFMVLPINGFMTKCIEEKKKGSASGWFQAGNLAGTGLGGGAGLWLATHYTVGLAGLLLSAASLLFASVAILIKDVQHTKEKTIVHEITVMGRDLIKMVKVPVTLYVILLLMMPIGSGSASNLWSAVAADWKTDADTVVLVTGLLSGLVSAFGCVAGGFIADKWGVWVAYLGTGAICALVTFLMAVLPFEPAMYIGGVLVYAFATGLVYAAFTAVILFAIGKRHVATKYSLLASLGNIPVVLMTAVDGWTHDKYNSMYMLIVEAATGMLFVIIFLLILNHMMRKKLIPVTIE